MKLVKDLVPSDSTKLYRYEKMNPNGTGTGEYMLLKYSPGTLAQVPTAVNRELFEDLYGYANETIVKNSNGSITKSSGGITETTVKNSNGSITTTKTDGKFTVKRTITKNGNTITKVVG